MLAIVHLLVLAASVSAVAIPRQDNCAATCQYVCYTQDAIDAALQAGYANYQSGQLAGTYPHEFDDREGFTIPTDGPWYEFPILASGRVYTGGPPGADRVVFDASGNLDIVVTHHGASGSNFVQCN